MIASRHKVVRPFPLSLASADHVLGAPTAPVVVLKYGSYCCPREAAAYDAVTEVRRAFADRVAVVYRHYPLVVAYASAFLAAEAAEAAAARGQFWAFHEHLIRHPRHYTVEDLVTIASRLGLDGLAVADDLFSHVHREVVTGHYHSGVRAGVRRVPCVFVNGTPQSDLAPAALCRAVAAAIAAAEIRPPRPQPDVA